MAVLEFENVYKISMFCLKRNRSHPDVAKDWRWAGQVGLMHGIFSLVYGAIAYSLFAVHIKEGVLTDICTDSAFLVVWFVVTAQYCVLLWYKDHLTTLIDDTQEYFDVADSLPAEDQVIVAKYAHTGRWVSKIWLISSTLNCALFPCKAFILTMYSYYIGKFKLVQWYDCSYPSPINEIKDNPAIFVVIFSLQLCAGIYAVLMYIGFTPLGPIFILNACGQLELLAKEIGTIFSDSPYNHENVSRKTAVIAKKLQRIYRYVELINELFEVLYELNLKGSAVLIPVTVYASIDSFQRGELSFEYMAFIFTAILFCYIPCFYCDLLMEKGEAVRCALYASGWERHPDRRARSSLLVMLTVAMRPVSIRTIFRTVCLNAFSETCNQAYALFNLINVARD